MKKVLFTFVMTLALLSAGQVAFAQYEKGDKLLNAGIGLGTYGAGGIGLGGSFEVGIHDAISVGGLFGYSGRNYFGSRFSVLTFGARGSYHFNELLNLGDERIDLYAGLGLGYRSITWNYSGIGSGSSWGSGVLFLGHIGGRYYFQPNIGAFAEVGSGFGTLQAGITFKF
ncbi:hypothetical protein GCM10027275_27800 [Rhabdobacter roseus]|uniref:Outer membrane protein beta-barrel domain-containing protein n=1 Tax=Rhabdobacter roseus TaxID=1655419 RepID=A0A840TWY5_9BACT|nr:hypothetical protein [Rhabdobacter roseus]MBB5284728.1 hypothetical protein [Rhabdobacter roseus]